MEYIGMILILGFFIITLALIISGKDVSCFLGKHRFGYHYTRQGMYFKSGNICSTTRGIYICRCGKIKLGDLIEKS